MAPWIFAVVLTAVALHAGNARSDVVTDWNSVTLDAIRVVSEPPPRATRVLAMVHVAMHDAVNGIEQRYARYHVRKPGIPVASPEASAAAAAHTVLLGLYEALGPSFDAALESSLDALADGHAKNAGRAWGRQVGRQILKLRQHDNAGLVTGYAPSGEPGYWETTPPNHAPALLPNWPYVTPFAMTTGDQFRPAPPPAIDSAEFREAYREVLELGAVASPLRAADQTEIAYFWEDGPRTVTPPGHWQLIAQQFSHLYGIGLWENARLFALLSIAQADAAIVSWDAKYFYDHVRPYSYITSQAAAAADPATPIDPTWENLIPSPPFPAYTSGHSTFSSASAVILARFFEADDMPFCGASPDPDRWPEALPGVQRCWDSFSQAAEEAGQSRVYGGIHWQYDNLAGLATGAALGAYVYDTLLRPAF
jgi:membrane-associated phospholipid phosphatase